MTGSDIIARALSIADLTNAGFVTSADQLNSLQEAYNDVHHILIDSDDDYYLTESIITVTSGMAAPGGNSNEYLITLPSDMFKLRYVDYSAGLSGQLWQRMERFTLAMKNYPNNTPVYRMKNSVLWVIGFAPSSVNVGMQVRLGYYPPPMVCTLLSVFDYPLNSVPELMAYQLAKDFLAKQGSPDSAKATYISERYQQMLQRFMGEIKRDEGKTERVQNAYDRSMRIF